MNYSNISLVLLQMKVKIDCNQWNARPRSYSGLNKALSDLVRDIKPIHQDSLMKSMDKW
jgi:hypothetical protein